MKSQILNEYSRRLVLSYRLSPLETVHSDRHNDTPYLTMKSLCFSFPYTIKLLKLPIHKSY